MRTLSDYNARFEAEIRRLWPHTKSPVRFAPSTPFLHGEGDIWTNVFMQLAGELGDRSEVISEKFLVEAEPSLLQTSIVRFNFLNVRGDNSSEWLCSEEPCPNIPVKEFLLYVPSSGHRLSPYVFLKNLSGAVFQAMLLSVFGVSALLSVGQEVFAVGPSWSEAVAAFKKGLKLFSSGAAHKASELITHLEQFVERDYFLHFSPESIFTRKEFSNFHNQFAKGREGLLYRGICGQVPKRSPEFRIDRALSWSEISLRALLIYSLCTLTEDFDEDVPILGERANVEFGIRTCLSRLARLEDRFSSGSPPEGELPLSERERGQLLWIKFFRYRVFEAAFDGQILELASGIQALLYSFDVFFNSPELREKLLTGETMPHQNYSLRRIQALLNGFSADTVSI